MTDHAMSDEFRADAATLQALLDECATENARLHGEAALLARELHRAVRNCAAARRALALIRDGCGPGALTREQVVSIAADGLTEEGTA